MTDFTAHFRFPIPDFTQEPWHAELQSFLRAVDTAIYQAVLIQNVGNWANSTVYSIGSIVIDSATGLMWTCAVANTSSTAPTTFAQERVAHPTFWNATANIPQQRGAWTTATSYIPGDFVVDTNRYAVCLVAHVSGVFNTDLAAGRWVVLVDLSALGVGINATVEATVASAATTNIGATPATRINITGVTGITSFGVVANTYKILRFSAALTITGSAAITLIGGGPRVTAANDIMWVSSDGVGNWRELMYTPASGLPLTIPDATTAAKGVIELATQGEVDLGVDTVRAVVPATLKTRLDALTTTILLTIRDGVSGTLDTLAEIATAIGFLAPKANPTFTGGANFDTIGANGITVASLTVSGGSTFPAGDVGLAELIGEAKPFLNMLFAQDLKSTNTFGQALTANAFTKRNLGITVNNIGATIVSDVITLPAGTYWVDGWTTVGANIDVGAGGTTAARFAVRLRNITGGLTLLVGQGDNINGSDSGVGGADLMNKQFYFRGVITVAAAQALELQVFVSSLTNVSVDGGRAANTGDSEIYSEVLFLKIG
jgi:hypothetical protein